MKMISGVGSYDIRSGQMLSLTWVWLARYADYYVPPYRGEPGRVASVLEWRRGDAKAAAPVESNAPGTETSVELADSTPEAALKTFLIALAAHDEPTLRAVSLPVDDLHLLLEGPLAPPEQLARIKARLEEKPMRRLKAGDPVKMPDGQSRVIKPGDVREGRVVLWPDGLPIPSRVENVGGHWKVFAAPFIAARKSSLLPYRLCAVRVSRAEAIAEAWRWVGRVATGRGEARHAGHGDPWASRCRASFDPPYDRLRLCRVGRRQTAKRRRRPSLREPRGCNH